jgi:hypothetical protein
VGPRPSAEWDALWEKLAWNDAAEAYLALWALARGGKQSVAFLNRRLARVDPVSPQRIARLIADLESERFAVRQQAAAELEQAVEQAEPALRQALASRPPLETRRRIAQILESLDPARSPSRRQALRALVVLEHAATPEARELLERVSRGAPQARLTQEAKAALERLAKRPADP